MKNIFRSMPFLIALTFSIKTALAAEVYFSPDVELSDIVVEEIQKAESSIDIAIYTFKSEFIRDAIEEKVASNPSIKVRVLIRKAKKSQTQAFMEPLNQALSKDSQLNPIRYVTTTNHHKFMIVDGKVLVNTSGNFNDSHLASTYDENMVVCSEDCIEQIQQFQAEFEFLYANSNSLYDDDNDSLLPGPIENDREYDDFYALFTSFNFYPVYSRGKITFRLDNDSDYGAVESVLVERIEDAYDSIRVATGHLRSWTLAKALIDAHDRGVDVEVILDSQEYITPEWQDKENSERDDCLDTGADLEVCYEKGFHFGRVLFENGVKVRFKYYMYRWNFIFAPQMHSKYMIIDEDWLYTGSYNWSKNAEFKTMENVFITDDGGLIVDFMDNFDELFYMDRDDYDDYVSSVEKQKRSLKNDFDPMALTVPEIDHLQELACKKCPSVFCPADGKEPEDMGSRCRVE